MYLSKSDFKVARTCPKKLFYRKQGYPSLLQEDEYLAMLTEGGFMVEKIAKLLYPEGQEIGFQQPPEEAFRDTMRALEQDKETLFEATFISLNKLARVDIIIKRGRELQLIEVKAKSYSTAENNAAVARGRRSLFWARGNRTIVSKWQEYIEDVAFQVLVLREVFPDATIRPFLMMPDNDKTTSIDNVRSLFKLRREVTPDSHIERILVSFLGDPDSLARDHFLALVPVTDEVAAVQDAVNGAAQEFVSSLRPDVKRLHSALSVECRDCEFRASEDDRRDGFKECWGNLADVTPHVLDLYHVGDVGGRGGPVSNGLIQDRKVSLFDIPVRRLTRADGSVGEINKRQRIQIDHTRDNSEWISPDLRGILESYKYPLHFIDFETTAIAVPYHSGMHPYEPVAFQWSCHTLQAKDARPEHKDWINVTDAFPNFEFASTLMEHIGDEGTPFMWAWHENTILTAILRQMADRAFKNPKLEDWLRRTTRTAGQPQGPIVDMNHLCLRHYFHPLMKGRTSIKKVCDAIWRIDPQLRAEFPEYLKVQNGEVLSPYEALPPLQIDGQPVVVAEGTGAIRAYEAMMYGVERDDPEKREQWKSLLLQYCKLDTAAMLMIWKHWSKNTFGRSPITK